MLCAIGSFAKNPVTKISDWMVGSIPPNNILAKASDFNHDDNSWVKECIGNRNLSTRKMQSTTIKTLEIQGHRINQIKNLKNNISVDINKLSNEKCFLIKHNQPMNYQPLKI